ncbi:carbohydrate ABC transporter membrane protein 1, CUT1 family [Leifsonia sp. 98AMF]|uniref:carbohydrate ABC transporter permease n=1 Tax=unclassified Leifsonia TaxID=2663824 RepID=UPI00087D34F1|nr:MULTISPECIES: sugar ABC transporter permease [unclassified Leifsonia]SDH46353.1 carbohydrate ABC transporter membrane protein 1, CUT1 family [Leifsonia sp. 197AMF]SDI91151.1 carbohydrate ABC transporter membrane protein 1, CUT1 family [Leifsonia sp. 466MF]SDJ88765.1 carbohydrate ABC transporter membrane protein 1, CUT1 family [Leifsonia sp. 157MF]SDN94826.1 carbohydrate ABC transporter membrane protein 1, CUT1 family [Leifsonia sp. 509MF]SEN10680.1 carbohydrate ABC transporter membrane prot
MSTTTDVRGPARTVPAAAAAPPQPKRRRPKGWWLPFILLAPAIVFELLIHVVPMLTGIWISFTQLTKFYIANWGEAPFVGLKNYAVALDFNGSVGAGLLRSFLVTVGFTILVVGLSWALGMAAAVSLQGRFRGRAFFRTLFLVPYALPLYAGIITWKFMFQKDTGAINHFLFDNLGLPGDKPFWLIGGNAFWSIVIVAIWRLWPFAFLMLMAGLQSIPSEVYEASAVDGAKHFRQWRAITLPMLRPVNSVLLLVMFLWTFNDFNTPFVLFGSTAQPAAGDLISFHIYNASFLTWNFGSGAAMSVLLLLFLLVVTGAYLLVVNRRNRNA